MNDTTEVRRDSLVRGVLIWLFLVLGVFPILAAVTLLFLFSMGIFTLGPMG
jgi:nitrate reductase NapE component